MNKNRNEIQRVINQLQKVMESIDFRNPSRQTKDICQYLEHYKLPQEYIRYHIGNLPVDNYSIKVQVFSPIHGKSGEVVLLLHGYLDHVGILSATIHFLTDEGYSVITFDWPGHGLSSGERADITHFEEYQRVYEALVKEVTKQYSSRLHVIAHSTGAAVVVNDLLTRYQQSLASIILVAPLIRSNLWTITKLGYYLAKPIVKKVKRVIRESSSDKRFTQFIQRDPCQPKTVPLNWLKALIDWNDRIHTVKGNDHRVLVLQGVDDETVDWKYNCRFVAKQFHNSEILLYDEGKHHLLNEKKEIRENVFNKIIQEIQGSNSKGVLKTNNE
ncbi:alpha/beta hydrolase [Alkalihalobacterium alkalinitrilicum]|uniref:alpha/beta hydrolase n=1 Tax=Alkalihalobacterium alkalinitrilicum TaxID=427920 RepID=UPI0009952A7C|nr:alpha/beta hydrolase [Alkalihalobacterium alkalinitrilicum]